MIFFCRHTKDFISAIWTFMKPANLFTCHVL